METVFNIHTCCRLCLKQGHSVLVNCTEIDELSMAIHTAFGFNILPTDNCSTKVCRECTSKITSFFMYRNTVLNNQRSIEQYQILQSKLDSVKIKDEVDDDVVFVSQQNSEYPPILEPHTPHLATDSLDQSAHPSYFHRKNARKSTAKPPFGFPPKRRRVKLRKVKVLCRRLLEKDISHVFLTEKDQKILKLIGKTNNIRSLTPTKTIVEKIPVKAKDENVTNTNNSPGENFKNTQNTLTKFESPSQRKVDEKCGTVTKEGRSFDSSPFYFKLNKLLESVVSKSINPSNPPTASKSLLKSSNQNTSGPPGLFYINPVAAASKAPAYRATLPKQPAEAPPNSESVPKKNTIISTVVFPSSSSPAVSSVSVPGSVHAAIKQNVPNLPSCIIRKISNQQQKPIKCTEPMSTQNTNANSIVFVGPNMSQTQGNFPTHFSMNTSTTISQPIMRPITVQQPSVMNTAKIQNRLIPSSIAHRRQQPITIKSEAVVTSSSQVNLASTSRDEYMPLEKLESNMYFIKTPISSNMIAGNPPNQPTVAEAQSMNDHRVKVLTVNELNMRAAEANSAISTIESRKLPIRITLVKIRNEVQIKLTDSKNHEIHFNNLTPQEQLAVKSSLLQPASKAQILAAIRTCMPDKYSQEMLAYLGIAVSDVILK